MFPSEGTGGGEGDGTGLAQITHPPLVIDSSASHVRVSCAAIWTFMKPVEPLYRVLAIVM